MNNELLLSIIVIFITKYFFVILIDIVSNAEAVAKILLLPIFCTIFINCTQIN